MFLKGSKGKGGGGGVGGLGDAKSGNSCSMTTTVSLLPRGCLNLNAALSCMLTLILDILKTAFWLLRGFILDLGDGGLLFHFILSKIESWSKQMGNLYPSPPPPLPKSRMGKWRVLAFARLHP